MPKSLDRNKDYRIYSSSHKVKGILSLRQIIFDFKDAIFLGRQLFVRDIKGMFRQSILGIVWAFLPPFFTAAIWIFLKSSGAVGISDVGMPYPVYVLTGTIIFQTISEAMRLPAESVLKGKSMLVKLNFPRESLVISSMLQITFNFIFKLLALISLLLIFKVSFGFSSLLFLPAVLGSVLFGFSIGVLLIPFQMLYTDFSKAVNLLMQVMLYLTPVVYAYPNDGLLLKLVNLNPLTPLVLIPRNLLVNHDPVMLNFYLFVIAGSFIVLLLGWIVYRITMPIVIERSGS